MTTGATHDWWPGASAPPCGALPTERVTAAGLPVTCRLCLGRNRYMPPEGRRLYVETYGIQPQVGSGEDSLPRRHP